MAVKKAVNGAAKLKSDLKNGTFAPLYVIHGNESYLKEYYRKALVKAVVDDTFREFNFLQFDGRVTPEQLSDALESYPAMAEKKLVLVTDFDLYKMPAVFHDVLPAMLADLPEYVCLIFYYDILEFKQDKRLKIHGILDKIACFAEFSYLDGRELIDWVRRRVHAQKKGIDDATCEYLIFLCGNSMINLITEIDKVCAYSTVDHIQQYHIDQVCTRILDAVIFDLTDAIAEGIFEKAISILQDLIAQKNEEVALFSSILRHMQRLYVAKLVEQSCGGERLLMDMVGSRSPFYVRKLSASARKLTLSWLRNAVQLCAATDAALKSSSVDRQKQIEITLLKLAVSLGEQK